MSRSIICSLALILLLTGVVVSGASAQALKVAVVDVQGIHGQYKALLTQEEVLNTWYREKRGYLETLDKYTIVSGEEFQEIVKLYETPKAQWTAEQAKREAEIAAIAATNEKKFGELQSVTGRTAEQNHQFNALSEMWRERRRELDALAQKYTGELKTKRTDMETVITAALTKVIEEVAKAKGFTLVLDKAFAYFSAPPVEDITADVVKALNESKGAGDGGGAN